MVNWQVAPASYEIANYDEPKIKYRQAVEEMIHALPQRTLKRKTFVTISTNVLCADIETSVTKLRPDIDPIDRDVYYPLEIALTKWAVSSSNKSWKERQLKTKFWMINPGKPPANGCVGWSSDHRSKTHKVEYEYFKPSETYLEPDIRKIVKEINEFLTPDRTLFSTNLLNCRQDLGCLKWLNRETDYKMKPVKVFSIEDLYIVLIRRLLPEDQPKDFICLSMAELRISACVDTYNADYQCPYHQDKQLEDDADECRFCAKAMSEMWSHALMDDILLFTDIFENSESTLYNAATARGH